MSKSSVAPCGLDCAACDIYRAPQCPEIAQRIVDRLRDERGIECGVEAIRCSTCRGERAACWCQDCRIRVCCEDERKLDSCHRCAEFPCALLSDWAQRHAHCAQALQRLWSLKEESCDAASSSRLGSS